MWEPQLRTSMGIGASVFTGGYLAPGAAVPAVGPASLQGPATVGRDGYGVIVPGLLPGLGPVPYRAACWGGVAALAGLVFLWCSLPK